MPFAQRIALSLSISVLALAAIALTLWAIDLAAGRSAEAKIGPIMVGERRVRPEDELRLERAHAERGSPVSSAADVGRLVALAPLREFEPGQSGSKEEESTSSGSAGMDAGYPGAMMDASPAGTPAKESKAYLDPHSGIGMTGMTSPPLDQPPVTSAPSPPMSMMPSPPQTATPATAAPTEHPGAGESGGSMDSGGTAPRPSPASTTEEPNHDGGGMGMTGH